MSPIELLAPELWDWASRCWAKALKSLVGSPENMQTSWSVDSCGVDSVFELVRLMRDFPLETGQVMPTCGGHVRWPPARLRLGILTGALSSDRSFARTWRTKRSAKDKSAVNTWLRSKKRAQLLS